MSDVNQSVSIQTSKNGIVVRVNLVAILTPAEEGGYNCYCPALKISTQGDNLKEATANMREATSLFIESCVARHCLSAALLKRNFVKAINSKKHQPFAPQIGKKQKTIQFPITLPLSV